MKNYKKCYELMKKQTSIISDVCFGKSKRTCNKCPYHTKDLYKDIETEIKLRKNYLVKERVGDDK